MTFLIFYSTITLKITREGCLTADNKKEQESKNTNEKKKGVRLYLSNTEISFCNAVSDPGSSDA